jgi:hypothetical protein
MLRLLLPSLSTERRTGSRGGCHHHRVNEDRPACARIAGAVRENPYLRSDPPSGSGGERKTHLDPTSTSLAHAGRSSFTRW